MNIHGDYLPLLTLNAEDVCKILTDNRMVVELLEYLKRASNMLDHCPIFGVKIIELWHRNIFG